MCAQNGLARAPPTARGSKRSAPGALNSVRDASEPKNVFVLGDVIRVRIDVARLLLGALSAATTSEMTTITMTGGAILLLVFLLLGAARAEPLRMKPLGVYCGSIHSSGNMSCRETTPVLWPPGSGQLALVEHHSNFRVRRQRHNGVGNNTMTEDDNHNHTANDDGLTLQVDATCQQIYTLWTRLVQR